MNLLLFFQWLPAGMGFCSGLFNRRTGENSIDRYTLPCGKQIASGKLLYNRGSPAWHPVMTPRSGMGMGREAKEGEAHN